MAVRAATGTCWAGVDVGGQRKGCHAVVIDENGVVSLRSGLMTAGEVLEWLAPHNPRVVGVDSPRAAAPDGQRSREGERLLARAVCHIRWTPDAARIAQGTYYEWIRAGLALYAALDASDAPWSAIEVFPTASWTRWCGTRGNRTRTEWTRAGVEALRLRGVPERLSQDSRDAIAAAVTARAYTRQETECFGAIVVPVPLPRPKPGMSAPTAERIGIRVARSARPLSASPKRRTALGTTAVADERRLAGAFAATMGELTTSLRVGHVATSPLRECFENQTVAEVRAWSEPASINNVPVRQHGQIIGVLENVNEDLPVDRRRRQGASDDRVGSTMRRLSGDMLIEAAHPLSELVAALLQPPHYRLVVGSAIAGIVTPSDLGKLPMRVFVYAQLAHLEATMLTAIATLFATPEDAVCQLDTDAQTQLDGDLDRMYAKHLNPALLELTSIKQKGLILLSKGVFTGDPAVVAADLDDMYTGLRNPLAHAASFVDDSLPALMRLGRQLDSIARWTSEASATVA